MAGRYLTDLADVCRAAGLPVIEVDGWKTRARSSGGFLAGRPNHLMTHHTASGPAADGWPDVNYMCYSSSIKPIANLYLARAGAVYVMAAGATNTNGVGRDPCGAIPENTMNVNAIGIEGANNGTGERWPDIQQDNYVLLVAALSDAYQIPPQRVHAHFEYAPARKIDPSGPSRWSPRPTGGGEANEWLMDRFRSDVAELIGTTPAPPVVKPIDPSLFGKWEGNFVDCIDEGTGEFWRIIANPDGTLKAGPFSHIPRGADEERYHKIRDRVIGPLVPVPHQDLQDMYDVEGIPPLS